jgi:hypothetical protein
MLTFSPPQPSDVADIAPHGTRDPLTTSPLPHTKPIAHDLTQKTCITKKMKFVRNPLRKILPIVLSLVRQGCIVMILQLLQHFIP